jgi:putative ABC transport system permease protein
VNLLDLATRNVLRNRLRSFLTVLGVAVAILAFLLLRTVIAAWTSAADYAAQDRLGIRHKVTFINPLPLRYKDEIGQIPGVKQITWANWFGAKDPQRETDFFASIAVDPESFLQVYDEVVVPEAEKAAWLANRRGALIGDALAKQMGWKVGQRIVLSGTIFPGEWEFQIEAIYTVKRPSLDRSTLWFHWNYLNERADFRFKDKAGWFIVRVDDPSQVASISQRIDARFDDRDDQTVSMNERAMNASFLGMLSAVLSAIDLVSIVILVIMMLILGNTIAMGVRERTNEYGMLRAIGFLPRHIASFVLLEAVAIGLAGGLVGLALSYPIVEKGVGRFLEENMGGMFPYFRLELWISVVGLVLSAVLGLVAAALPAYQASRLNVVGALRRVG